MANIKITDLTAYADPTSTDVLPIVDVGADVTKKVSVADLLENAGSGTEALPGIAFDGDPNTGIYRPGPDQLAISTNSTERLRIKSDGKVGIGTTDPAVAFDVVGQVRASTGILFGGDTAAANALNDYEEGTFTPTIARGVTAITYNTNSTRGTYRIIGKQLFFTLRVRLTAGTANGDSLQVGGFPIAPSLAFEYRWISVGHFQFGASGTGIHAVGYTQSLFVDIYDSSDRSLVTGIEATNALDLQITGSYPIS